MSSIRVFMLETSMGVDDGKLYPTEFKEGEEYDIGPDLFSQFKQKKVVVTNLKKNTAEDIVEPKQNEEKVEKMQELDIENKMVEEEVSNKSSSSESKSSLTKKSNRKKGGKS